MFVKGVCSDFLGFLAELSLVRRSVLLGLTIAVLSCAVTWIWTQNPFWGFVTLGFGAFWWAVLGASVAQVSRTD